MVKETNGIPIVREAPNVGYEKVLWRGFLLGIFVMGAANGRKPGPIGTSIAGQLLTRSSPSIEEDQVPEDLSIAKELFDATEYWHGSGRYQYSDAGVIDTFGEIVRNGGLMPRRDDIDLVGPMHSISLARSRPYARCYADMHRTNDDGYRYGSTPMLAVAYIAPLAISVAYENKIWRPENARKLNEHFRTSSLSKWYAKARNEPTGPLGIFARGSDIENNYPIIFGIKHGEINPAITSRSVAVHEVRSTQPIMLSQVSYIEVPAEKIAEIKAILGEHGYGDIAVVSIEQLELLANSKGATAVLAA